MWEGFALIFFSFVYSPLLFDIDYLLEIRYCDVSFKIRLVSLECSEKISTFKRREIEIKRKFSSLFLLLLQRLIEELSTEVQSIVYLTFPVYLSDRSDLSFFWSINYFLSIVSNSYCNLCRQLQMYHLINTF